jgi:DNA-binding PadR family transcriptional regulator
MRYRHGCGPRGHIEIDIPEGLMAMRGGRGWQGQWGPFHFDFGDEDDRGWGRGRRRRTQLGSDDLRLLLLFLIADKPRHGYDLIKAVEQLSDGSYVPSAGVVYPTLTMLQDMGHIEELPGEGARKTYQVTDEGRAFLEERADEMPELLERLGEMGARHRPTSAGPTIGRAVRNLMTALTHRIGRDGVSDDLLHEIAAILDEAAQRIERVK